MVGEGRRHRRQKEEGREFFGPELLKLLKGKSCFYLKELTPEIERQMEDALRRGSDLYESRGWV